MLLFMVSVYFFTSGYVSAMPFNIDESLLTALAKTRTFSSIESLRKETLNERIARHHPRDTVHSEKRTSEKIKHKKRQSTSKVGPAHKWHDPNYYPQGNGICNCKLPPSNPCPQFPYPCCTPAAPSPCCAPAPVEVKPPPPPKKPKKPPPPPPPPTTPEPPTEPPSPPPQSDAKKICCTPGYRIGNPDNWCHICCYPNSWMCCCNPPAPCNNKTKPAACPCPCAEKPKDELKEDDKKDEQDDDKIDDDDKKKDEEDEVDDDDDRPDPLADEDDDDKKDDDDDDDPLPEPLPLDDDDDDKKADAKRYCCRCSDRHHHVRRHHHETRSGKHQHGEQNRRIRYRKYRYVSRRHLN